MASTPLSLALDRVGDRWSLLIVDALLDGPLRYADLEARVGGISTNILSARLRHLEDHAVVLATPYSDRPRRLAYELTEAGRGLAGAVRSLAQWGVDHPGAGAGHGAEAPVHRLCGTPMRAVWWCPTCERAADPDTAQGVWV